jgi:two-component system, OmpR family, KDP operon response regulator KdpE
MSTILVIDGEAPIRRTLDINLRAGGYDVWLARTGHQALALAARHHPDVALLDLGLPDISGMDVIRGLRGWTSLPIIVLSAYSAETDKVDALDAGANDYVSKPFGMAELMARVRVALRATTIGEEAPVVETADFTIDLAARRIHKQHEEVRLTATEWQVVEVLARNPGKLITHRHLLEQVWGLADLKTSILRVFMVAIRRKLEPDPSRPRYFVTERGAGIRFVPQGIDPGDGVSQSRMAPGSAWRGSVAVTLVPCPDVLWISSEPPSASTRSVSPTRPEPAAGSAPPMPSSAIDTITLPSRRSSDTSIPVACACFAALARASDAT